jgi:PKD repeat protein
LYVKLKKSKKEGISTFIAVLLMMVLAVAAGVVIYAYTMGYLGSFGPPRQPGTLQVQSIAQDVNGVHIYAKNIGKSTVVLDTNSKAYVDGQLVNGAPYTISPIPTTVNEGETREFLIQGFTQEDVGKTKEVKIVFNDGGFTATSVKITQDVVSGGATTYSVVYVLGTGGSTMNPTGTQTYAPGSSIAISATPDGTHTFSQWQATGSITFDSATSASTNAHINGAGTITATFSTSGTQYTVTFVMGVGGASISPTPGGHTYGDGSVVPITATAATGFHFTTWSSDTGSITFDSATSASTNAHIGAAGTITATFAADIPQYSVTFVLGTGGDSMTPTAGAHIYDSGSSVAITATPATNYHFDSWSSDTGSITFDNAASASTNAHIGAAGTITANFALDTYTLVVLVSPTAAQTAGCYVTQNPVGPAYPVGTSVTLTPVTATGYTFVSWSGDAVVGGIVTIDTDPSVTATFTANPVAAFTSTPTGLVVAFNGSTSSDPDGTIASYAWTFGDSATGTGVAPPHTYASAGSYTVRLTVTDNQGATNYIEHTVTVSNPPQTIILRPSGTGTTNNLNNNDGYYPYDPQSANWGYVDDTTLDNDSTYVYRDGSLNYDLYAMQNHGSETDTITSITVHIVSRISGGTGTATEYIRINSNNYNNPTAHTLSNTYTDYSYTWANNPNTGTAWTWAQIDALECGVGLYHYNSGNARCTQVWVVVTYQP